MAFPEEEFAEVYAQELISSESAWNHLSTQF
jgi:hypothetical protein